mmetsp:Transcript_16594/g.41435  ORF Transcript_16594/g.41435 Transcript_16594/m.41435 type:complete len:288 (+) Transcript_16594:607-1470(+)
MPPHTYRPRGMLPDARTAAARATATITSAAGSAKGAHSAVGLTAATQAASCRADLLDAPSATLHPHDVELAALLGHLGLRLGCGVFGHVDQLQRLALESMWRASCQEGLCLLHTVRKLGHVLRVLCQGLMLCHVELKRSVLQRPHHHCVKLKFGSPLLVSNVPQLRHLSHAAQWKTVVQLHLSRQGAPQLLLLPVDDVALVAFHVVDAPTERVEHGPVHSPVHEVFDLPHRHRAQRWRVACNGAEHHRLEATVAVVLHELAQALLVLECGGAPFHLPLSLGLQDDRL